MLIFFGLNFWGVYDLIFSFVVYDWNFWGAREERE
jgi:hypothetical protein